VEQEMAEMEETLHFMSLHQLVGEVEVVLTMGMLAILEELVDPEDLVAEAEAATVEPVVLE
jgi:hypothetical protein